MDNGGGVPCSLARIQSLRALSPFKAHLVGDLQLWDVAVQDFPEPVTNERFHDCLRCDGIMALEIMRFVGILWSREQGS